MKFDLEHDWQGNMSTPRKNLGEKTKLHLFFILSLIFLLTGLVGHEPWRPLESTSISIILDVIQNNQVIMPMAASDSLITHPPLYSYVGAAFGRLLSPILPLHDGARLANIFWMALTLVSLGLMTRELWGKGFGRQAGLIFIGSVGLILNIHSLIPELATLLGYTTSLYAFSLYFRRPFRASMLLGFGSGIAFLSGAFTPLVVIYLSSIFLLIFNNWRNKRYFIFIAISSIITIFVISPWLYLFHYLEPDLFLSWIKTIKLQPESLFKYHLQGILWFTWPALPLAIWLVIKDFKLILSHKKLQIPIIFFLVLIITISITGQPNQTNLIPFTIPLSIIAVGAIDRLNRGSASALNWFGILIFGLVGFLIWLGWFAMLTEIPGKIYERMFFNSSNFVAEFELFNFLFALVITLLWLASIVKFKITNRSAISNWALGITMVWVTLITLWGPFIDNRKDYKIIFNDVKQQLIKSSSCVYVNNLSDSQINLLHYYSGIRGINPNLENKDCRLVLISLTEEKEIPAEYKLWDKIWTGKRLSDKNYFVLLAKKTSN
jgi:4-amino-4-deoxy-L-arabinose transferase-like glycosyltransferase|tara:strand:- start:382 stop:2028 length:1647 start_codon:yes stop_codon:yes gene_type:complete